MSDTPLHMAERPGRTNANTRRGEPDSIEVINRAVRVKVFVPLLQFDHIEIKPPLEPQPHATITFRTHEGGQLLHARLNGGKLRRILTRARYDRDQGLFGGTLYVQGMIIQNGELLGAGVTYDPPAEAAVERAAA